MLEALKLGAVLILVVLLLNRKWNLGLALVVASVLLGILFSRPVTDLLRDAFLAITDLMTIRLAGIVILILTLGELMRRTARLDGMVHALEGLVPDGRIVFAVVPAVIGLLPMVGGAMFSAPMVDSVGDRLGASAGRKTFVNYWFRHFWEYVFPLYPSFLLGAELLGFSEHPQEVTGIMWPLAAASVIGGVLFGLWGLERRESVERVRIGMGLRELLLSIWPIGLVLVLSMMLRLELLISLAVTILALALISRIDLGQFREILINRIRWSTILVIFGAMIFRQVLEATGSVTAVSQLLATTQVPVSVGVFAIPFIAGLLSGLGTASFAIGFPIVLPLITSNSLDIGLAAWAWLGGFLGVMVSPVHLCLALTKDYFQSDWSAVYRRLLPAGLLTIAAGVLLLAVR